MTEKEFKELLSGKKVNWDSGEKAKSYTDEKPELFREQSKRLIQQEQKKKKKKESAK